MTERFLIFLKRYRLLAQPSKLLKMIMLLRFVTYLILAYCIAVIALYCLQRKMMYFPSQKMVSPEEAGVPEMQEVILMTPDKLALKSWYAPPRESKAGDSFTIVYFHGNAGGIADRAQKIRPYLEHGYGILLVEYRGYSGNKGVPNEHGLYNDGRAALSFLSSKGVVPKRVVIIGESLGTGVAVQMATELSIGALVLEAPFTSTVDVAEDIYWFVPVKWLMKDRFESVSKIDKVSAPVLIIHGGQDTIIPIELAEILFSKANDPKEALYIAEAGHNDLTRFGSTMKIITFLRAQMEPKKN